MNKGLIAVVAIIVLGVGAYALWPATPADQGAAAGDVMEKDGDTMVEDDAMMEKDGETMMEEKTQ